MPGPVMTVREAIEKYGTGYKVGIIKRKNKYYIRTEAGHWKTVTLKTKVWHRGKGRWSVYTGKVDRNRLAGTIVSEKRHKRYKHTGDKLTSTV